MKIDYDAGTNRLTVIFRHGVVAESDESRPGVILGYDGAGNLLSVEVLGASERVEEPTSVTFTTRS
jgi:uncharacterized protein YuzE